MRGQTAVPSWGGAAQVVYGIERFFVAETSPQRQARSGTVVAKIRVNRRHIARIEALVELHTK
jgi:hypothetical protein